MNTFNERIFAFPVKYEIKFQKKNQMQEGGSDEVE